MDFSKNSIMKVNGMQKAGLWLFEKKAGPATPSLSGSTAPEGNGDKSKGPGVLPRAGLS